MTKGTSEDILMTLVDVLNQACQTKIDKGRIFCNDFKISAYEDGFTVLELEGYARLMKKGKHKGLWLLTGREK